MIWGKIKPGKKTAGAGALALALSIIPVYEGMQTKAYRDIVGVVTICYGHTENVLIHDVKTPKECEEQLATDVKDYLDFVDAKIIPEVTDNKLAAATSFTYNLGKSAFSKSTFLKKLNAEDPRACDEIMRWVYVGGKDCRVRTNLCYGIIKRRQAEYELCSNGT